MVTANDIVHIGDKIEVSGGSTYCVPHKHILAQVGSNLFTLIDLNNGNRVSDVFPCKYGTRLRSERQSSEATKLYGSFTLSDLKDAICSQSHSMDHIGYRDCDLWEYKIIERYCLPHVFEELAVLWNKMEGKA